MSDINVVPYIDVMLVLLVIFMVTAPLFNQGVEVNLPNAPANPLIGTSDKKEPLIVSVNAAGQMFINRGENPDMPVNEQEFRNKAQQILSNEKGVLTYVRGDRSVDYGRVVSVMVMLQGAGAENIGLITDPDAKE